MLVKVLVEDSALPGFEAAHGLSLYIETGGRRLLFDLGPDDTVFDNAEKSWVDLFSVDGVVISHGHDDHGGALPRFLEHNDHAVAYVRSTAFRDCLSERPDGLHSIGIAEALKDYPRVMPLGKFTYLGRDLQLFSDVPTSAPLPASNGSLYAAGPDGPVPDDFSHEQNLIAIEGDTAVLFTGCAHRGIVNILERAEEVLGRAPDYVAGGFHLMRPSTGECEDDEVVREVADKLAARGQTRYFTGHCTGEHAFNVLKDVLGDRIEAIHAGSVLEL